MPALVIAAPARASAATTATTAPQPGFFGTNLHPIWADTSYQDKSLNSMAQAGVQSARLDAPWNFIEPQRGVYNATYLARLDYSINGMVARNIKPLIIVLNAPQWANGSTNSLVPPINNQDFAAYLGVLMQRYHGKVHEFEIWNEPNGGWAWANPDPVKYTALLKASYVFAKAQDPTITILGGSLSGTDGGPQNFLRTMYVNGAKNYFDVLSAHVYGDPPHHGNATPEVAFGLFTQNMVPLMNAAGDGAKPVWFTEHGYNTSGGGVSRALQADYLTRAYNYVRTMPNAVRLYYYEWSDEGTDPTNAEQAYGLVDTSWNNKPSYAAFAALTGGATTAPPTPTPTTSTSPSPSSSVTPSPSAVPSPGSGTVQVNDNTIGSGLAQVQYAGAWQYAASSAGDYQNDLHYSYNPGVSATVAFTGTGVTYVTATNGWQGIAGVSVDGAAPTRVDLYSVAERHQVPVFTVAGLTAGSHRLTVSVLGAKNAASVGTGVSLDQVTLTTTTPGPTPSPSPTASPTPSITVAPSPSVSPSSSVAPSPSAVPSPGSGTVQVNDNTTGSGLAQVQYVGAWKYTATSAGDYQNDLHYSYNPGVSATVAFTGTEVTYWTAVNGWQGIAGVSVDGAAPTRVDLYSATERHQVPVFTVAGLTPGSHRLTVSVLGAQNAASVGAGVSLDRVTITDTAAGPSPSASPTPVPPPPRRRQCLHPPRQLPR